MDSTNQLVRRTFLLLCNYYENSLGGWGKVVRDGVQYTHILGLNLHQVDIASLPQGGTNWHWIPLEEVLPNHKHRRPPVVKVCECFSRTTAEFQDKSTWLASSDIRDDKFSCGSETAKSKTFMDDGRMTMNPMKELLGSTQFVRMHCIYKPRIALFCLSLIWRPCSISYRRSFKKSGKKLGAQK